MEAPGTLEVVVKASDVGDCVIIRRVSSRVPSRTKNGSESVRDAAHPF